MRNVPTVLVLVALAWGSLVSFVLLWVAADLPQMFVATLLLALAFTTIMPLIETVAVSGIRTAGLHYGKVRLWGTIGWIVAGAYFH